MNNGVVLIVVVIAVVLAVGVAITGLIVGVFVFGIRYNLKRSRAILGDAVKRWAAAKGYEVVSSERAGLSDDHPFRKSRGFRALDYGDAGGLVYRVVVADRDDRERAGWLFIPLQIEGGGLRFGTGRNYIPDWQNARVAWDRR